MRMINLAGLPGDMSASETRDEVWLRQNLLPAKVEPKPAARKRLPRKAEMTLDGVDDLLVRVLDLLQELYDLRERLLVASDK